MARNIDFYFDFSSPYGYFAAMRIEALAAKYQREVKWHAILLGIVFQTTGSVPLTTIPVKGNYAVRDIKRTARFNDIDFNMPGTFPISTTAAARAILWLQGTADAAKDAAFAKAIYRAYFFDGIDIGNSANIALIATSVGVNAAAMLEGIGTAEIKEKLKSKITHAIEKGVFGSPYMIVDDEPFWGFDRFDQLEAMLKSGKI